METIVDDQGTAVAKDYGTARVGSGGKAIAGDCGNAIAGNYGTATVGNRGTAMAGRGGRLVIEHYDGGRYRLVVGYIGEGGLFPNTPYQLDDEGNFITVAPVPAPAVVWETADDATFEGHVVEGRQHQISVTNNSREPLILRRGDAPLLRDMAVWMEKGNYSR